MHQRQLQLLTKTGAQWSGYSRSITFLFNHHINLRTDFATIIGNDFITFNYLTESNKTTLISDNNQLDKCVGIRLLLFIFQTSFFHLSHKLRYSNPCIGRNMTVL